MIGLQEGKLVHKAEMLEMDFLKSLGIEPNFTDVSRHIEKLLAPALDTTDDAESGLEDLRLDNEELESQVSGLEDKLDSLDTYARRMRKELDKLDFEGKGEIEAILEDIEGELEL
jgi:hypothetical protein